MIRRSLSIVFATFLAVLFTTDAFAAAVSMCRGTKAGAASGPASWTARGSQTTYRLDVRGCSVIAAADIPDAIAGGFVSDRTLRADTYTGLSYASSPLTITLPPGTFISALIAQETSGAAVPSGGIKIGTTNGGTDVVNGWAIGSSAYTTANDASILKRVFSATASQQLFVTGIGSLVNNVVNVTIVYGYF